MKIRIILWCLMLVFFAGSVASLFAKEYLDKTMSHEYKASIDKKIVSMDSNSGDKFVLGYVVLGNNTYYVFRDAQHGNLEYIDKATVLLIEDNETLPSYMDCSQITVCEYGEGKSRKLVVPVGYELKYFKADINLV